MRAFTPVDVEIKLVELSAELDVAHKDLDEAEHAYAQAKSAWEINSARVRLSIRARAMEAGQKKTIQEIEDEATVRCSEELLAHYTSEALVKSARANNVRVRTQIDIARSVGTSVRAAMDLA